MTEHKQYNPGQSMPTLPKDNQSPNIQRYDKTLVVKDLHILSDVEFETKRGQKFGRTSFSGSVYSAAATDYLIAITSLALAPTIGLPKPALAGACKAFIVKDEAGGAGTTTITIRSGGEETIDGASTATLTANYQSKSFYTDGTNWFTY
jgi:hypothetical protein